MLAVIKLPFPVKRDGVRTSPQQRALEPLLIRAWEAVPTESAQSRMDTGLMLPFPPRARPPEMIEVDGNDIVIPQMWMRK
jgi:hypothetical protein